MSTLPPGMSTPPPPLPPPASSSKRGCIIAALVVLLVLLAGCSYFCFSMAGNPGKMMGWGLEKMRAPAMTAVAADVPADLKQQFETEYDAYLAWVKAPGNITKLNAQTSMQPLQHLQSALGDKALSAEEIEHFLELSRTTRGASAPAAP